MEDPIAITSNGPNTTIVSSGLYVMYSISGSCKIFLEVSRAHGKRCEGPKLRDRDSLICH